MDSPNAYGGGTVYANGNLTVDKSIFDKNTVTSQNNLSIGSAIFAGGNNTQILINNTEIKNGESQRAAVYVWRSNTIIDNTTFINNNGTENGGALHYYNGEAESNSLTVINSAFNGNTADNGGALYLRYGVVNVANTSFTKNNASTGGAIYNGYSNELYIENSSFIKNYACDGGAIVNHHATSILTIADTRFINNTADTGAAIDTKVNLTISNSEFVGNGIYCINVSDDAKLTLNNDSSDAPLVNDTISFEILGLEDLVYGKDANIEVQVNSSIITSLNGAKVIVKVNNVEYNANLEDGIATFTISNLNVGNYTATIIYEYEAICAAAETTVDFNVSKDANYTFNVDVHYDDVGKDVEITVTLPEDATGYILVDIEQNGYYAPIKDGKASVNIFGLEPGTYDANITCTGDDEYDSVETTREVTVPEVELLDADLSMDINGSVIILSINENATGQVILSVGGISFVFDARDLLSVDVSEYLSSGTYYVGVKYSGDDVFAGDAIIGGIVVIPEIEPENANFTATAENATITVSVNPDATGNVLVDVADQGYYAPIKGGQATINVIGLDDGEYEATVTYTGDNVFAAANTTVAVTVPSSGKNDTPVDPQADINISADRIEVTLPENATGYVLVDVDGTGYYTTVKNGQASFELPKLTPGNHTITVTYTGDRKYDSANATEVITVKGPTETIFSEDLTKVEKAPDRFEANFTDVEGNPLANTNVTFELNGNVYTRITDVNGKAGMNINLEADNYTVIITNPATGEVKNNTITVLSRFVDAHDLVKYFRNESQYVLTVLDDDGKVAANGTVVTFNINGVFYNRTVNETGQVKLSINLNPGDYIITAEYKGCKVSNKIKVLPVLDGNDLTKKYGEISAYEVTLVDGQGKAYNNQKIEFNINGVLYYRTTDSNGIARLNINLMPGKYIITAAYGEATISNNITVIA